MYTIPAIAARNLARSPEAFLSRPIGQTWLDQLATAYPHERYVSSRSDTFSDKDLNTYASKIITAKRKGLAPDELLEEHFYPCNFSYAWYHEVLPDLEAYLRETGKRDTGRWTDEIREGWEDRAADADESSITDLFRSYDTCEILFALVNVNPDGTACLEDRLVESHRSCSEASELAITPNLQFPLNQIGYTMSEYRKLSGNKHPTWAKLKPRRPRRPKIVDWQRLESVIDNACSSYFNFYLYAIVPITDLLKLDLTKSITFERAWLATMNPFNGTFHDEVCDGPVTVAPTDGYLLSGADVSYSPDDICGLVRSYYASSLKNEVTHA